MKKPKFLSDVKTYIIFMCSPLCLTIISLFYHSMDGIYLSIIIFMIIAIPLIIFRKQFFLKMLINENGITKYYGKKIIKELKWEDIKDVLVVNGRQIIFSDILIDFDPIYYGKELKNVVIDIYMQRGGCTYFFLELCKYKNRIPVEIRCIDRLQPEIAKRLKKDNN